MPNYCDYSIHIKGQKKDVLKLCEWLSAQYCYSDGKKEVYIKKDGIKIPTQHHIGWRIFECYYNPDDFVSLPADVNITLYAFGYCAWSVYTSMMEGAFTYYSDNHDEMVKEIGEDLSLSLPMACKLLSVEAEIFSSESGMCFAEHYHISSDGEVLLEEEEDYMEIYIDDFSTYDEYLKSIEGECIITKEDFDAAKGEGSSTAVKCEWIKDNEWPFRLV